MRFINASRGYKAPSSLGSIEMSPSIYRTKKHTEKHTEKPKKRKIKSAKKLSEQRQELISVNGKLIDKEDKQILGKNNVKKTKKVKKPKHLKDMPYWFQPDYKKGMSYEQYLASKDSNKFKLSQVQKSKETPKSEKLKSKQVENLQNPVEKVQKSAVATSVKSFTSSTKDNLEIRFCIDLATKLKGQTEVNTLDGRIDVLTTTQLIEAKVAKNWKHGIGQLLVYGSYFPNKQLTLVLIGDDCLKYAKQAKRHCHKFNILVTTEFDY